MTGIDKHAISEMIPHAGSMILLDGVERYDDERLVAITTSHVMPDNPLRDMQGRLHIACGIEYAAQAMAIHGGLLRATASGAPPSKPRVGLLAGLRGIVLCADYLDEMPGPLRIEVASLSADDRASLYTFEIRAGDRLMLSGRATVVHDAINPGLSPVRAAKEVAAGAG